MPFSTLIAVDSFLGCGGVSFPMGSCRTNVLHSLPFLLAYYCACSFPGCISFWKRRAGHFFPERQAAPAGLLYLLPSACLLVVMPLLLNALNSVAVIHWRVAAAAAETPAAAVPAAATLRTARALHLPPVPFCGGALHYMPACWCAGSRVSLVHLEGPLLLWRLVKNFSTTKAILYFRRGFAVYCGR